MTDQELAFTPAHQMAKLIARKELSPVELTGLYLERIDRLDPQLNAFLTVAGDQAMDGARAAEKQVMDGEELGALHGVPIGIKDLEMTAGIRTTFGSLVYKDHVPDNDSGIVERVRRSGAIILGKTNTPEFGVSGTTENRLGDDCRNPWDTTRTTGGSSGGAGAAVAAGLCPLATGSDAGGSIRIPASFCGVYGIKPTLGRVPRFGGVARAAPNPVSQAGPMTLDVESAALMLQVLAGPDKRDVIALREPAPDYLADIDRGIQGVRIAWSPDLGEAAVDPEVVEITRRAAAVFEELGATVEEPKIEIKEPYQRLAPIAGANLYAAYGYVLDEHRDDLSDNARGRLERGREVTGAQYAGALRYLEELRSQMGGLMESYDLLLTPTMAVTAFPIGQRPDTIGGRQVESDWAFNPFNVVFNATQQPAASVPCGFNSDGLPVGLHVIGRREDEVSVLQASKAFEGARPWADKRPPVS